MDQVGLTGDELELGYHGRHVVDGASLHIEAARVTALVGPNGSGKSTLLRALAACTTRTPGASPSPAAATRSPCRRRTSPAR
ncbi:ATP-binding cassette domain-containing protein [Kribbella sp. WER1]